MTYLKNIFSIKLRHEIFIHSHNITHVSNRKLNNSLTFLTSYELIFFSCCSRQNLSSHHPCSADCVQTRPRSCGVLLLHLVACFCSPGFCFVLQLLVTHPLRFIFEFSLWRYYQMSTRVYYFLLSETGACFSCDWILDNGVWFRRLCPLTSLGSVQGGHELGYEEPQYEWPRSLSVSVGGEGCPPTQGLL